MNAYPGIPDAAFVRVTSGAGPFRAGDLLALAFSEPTVARMLALEIRSSESVTGAPLVPDVATLVILRASSAFASGDELLASFTDPALARIHLLRTATSDVTTPPVALDIAAHSAAPLSNALHSHESIDRATYAYDPASDYRRASRSEITSRVNEILDSALVADDRESAGVANSALDSTARETEPLFQSFVPGRTGEPAWNPFRTDIVLAGDWSEQRRRRSLNVIDRLFTVERLGLYRHSFAIRALLAEGISGPEDTGEIATRFASFRASAVEALGAPLLEAYLPTFAIDARWLETIDSRASHTAFKNLSDVWAACVPEDIHSGVRSGRPHAFDRVIAAMIATDAAGDSLRVALDHYREHALRAFADADIHTSSEAAIALDDRLWALAGALHDSLTSSAA